MIDNKLIIQDTGLAERIVTSAGYAFWNEEGRINKDDMIVVLWNWWIKN